MKKNNSRTKAIVRGAGEMASGVIYRLFNEGYDVIALEQPNPCCVRRAVCFAGAVYDQEITIGGIKARLIRGINDIEKTLDERIVPILIDSKAEVLNYIECDILIDGRMLKIGNDISIGMSGLVIGLGPGFTPRANCHLAVETNRGETLGAVYDDRSPRADTGVPASVNGFTTERVLRAPVDGILNNRYEIGEIVKKDDIIADINGIPVKSEINGILRGICRNGINVAENQKIGDIDPRGDRELCFHISDKAKAIAGGVLRGIRTYEKSRAEVRKSIKAYQGRLSL